MPIPAILTALAPGVLEAAGKLIDRLFPDPEAAAKAKVALMQAEGQQALAEMQLSMAAIVAEAQSADPWTSRARPTFLYVVYLFIVAALPMGVVFAFAPTTGQLVAEGVRAWLGAIPQDLWWLFGAGYLGYSATRSFDKWKSGAK